MDIKKYTESNRMAWNEIAPKHEELKREAKKQFFEPGFSCLDEIVTEKLAEIGLEGKRVAQVCCNDGVETLSLKNLGAADATGFDISDGAIEAARQLAEATGIECEFVRTDIYEVPEKYERSFDLIYISAGVLVWMPNLPGFFKIVRRLLKTGGKVLIYEMHPFLKMLDEESETIAIKYSYFTEGPQMYDDGITYMGNEDYKASPAYNFDPKLSDIVNAMIKGGLQIAEMQEYPHDLSPMFEHLEEGEILIPMSFMLMGHI
ncbi:MAG TPA: class I SAM-dependent methyltransferase [Bacillales bacterium]|nr:class I SAM-dependent methyltransferase [Bacillales bacterium]